MEHTDNINVVVNVIDNLLPYPLGKLPPSRPRTLTVAETYVSSTQTSFCMWAGLNVPGGKSPLSVNDQGVNGMGITYPRV